MNNDFKIKFNNSKNHSTITNGGDSQEWKNFLLDIGQNVECQSQDIGKDMVKTNSYLQTINVNRPRQIDNSKLLFPRILNFDDYETQEDLFSAIADWWVNTLHKAPKTIRTRISCARQFSNHDVYPINWLTFDENPEQIINLFQYLINYEYKHKAIQTGNLNYGIFHLYNLRKTVNTFARAKGIDVSWWNIDLPEAPENKVKNIPNPFIVNKLIHHKYTNNKYENALIKTILSVGFYSGLRPNEIFTLKVENIDFENGLIVITEQKKRYRNRQIRIEKPVMYSKQQPSLKNFVKWRKQVTDSEKGFLFLQKNGFPFPSEDALRNYLASFVKPVWENFCPKIMRDWNAISRLIQTKVKTGTWEIRSVTKALGHKHESQTDTYTEFAELYYENFKFDWLRSVLKLHPNSKKMKRLVGQDYRSIQKDEKLTNAKKGSGLIKTLLKEKMLPTGRHNFLSCKKNQQTSINIQFKPFFFLFRLTKLNAVCKTDLGWS